MLTVHRAERSDVLVAALGEVLAVPPADALAPEVIAVPAKGVERWLTQQLSERLGVAANIAFDHPAKLVAETLAAAHGIERDDDPWAPGRLVWTLLEVIDDSLGEPWCALLADHLGAGGSEHRRGRRYGTAEALSRLFASYGENRPRMLVDWAAGGNGDGAGGEVDAEQLWQVELWRRLRNRIDVESPAERLEDACRRLVDEPGLVDLPERLSLFGATRLPRAQLDVLEALAVRRDVHLWLTHPSHVMWDKLDDAPAPVRRSADDNALLLDNPLLSGLARDIRELQTRLRGAHHVYHPSTDTAAGTLAAVRADIAADRVPGAAGRFPHDASVQVHACHGAARQVEVLREVLLGLLDADDTLQPRDIIVLCPDVDTFAPLIAAAFGQPDAEHPGHQLRVRLADRGLLWTNPLLDIASKLLRLADGRVTAGDVLDLAATEPVRRRFGFSDDDEETLRSWTTEAGARWGLTERQRAAHGLTGVRQNTFATALDRILLGVAADETELRWLDLALPLDDVESSDVELAGNFAELCDRLAKAVGRLSGERPAAEWTAMLLESLDELTDVAPDSAWQRVQATRELSAVTEHAGEVRLRLADVRSMLARRLAARPTRSNFRTGELTVCSLVPMRSVPHRVVAVIGVDDGSFPRAPHADGDDVLARDPCIGERDPRSEDRQLLLDAVLSATDHLLVCYTGADPVTGAARPPATPVAELIDAVKSTVTDPDEVVTRQPLQPFDPGNFRAPAPFSFDRAAFDAARAAQRPQPAPAFLDHPLPPQQSDVDLGDLVDFLGNPTRAFLRQRLGFTPTGPADEIADALPLSVAGLERWQIGDRMLAAALAGADLQELQKAELRRGTLPAGQLGLRTVDGIARTVAGLRDAASGYLAEPAENVDVAVDLAGGRRLSGTVTGVRGKVLLTVAFGSLSPKQRLTAWVRLLSIAAATGDDKWQAVVLAPIRANAPRARQSVLTVPANPVAVLDELVAVYDKGLREPIPLAAKTSECYAARRAAGENVDEARSEAARTWTSTMDRYGENDDAAIRFVHGSDAPFDALWETEPQADEQWSDEPSRFGMFARWVWDPLLASEQGGLP